MKNKFILGMVVTSLSLNTALAVTQEDMKRLGTQAVDATASAAIYVKNKAASTSQSLNNRMKQDFSQETGRSVKKDMGLLVASGLTVTGLTVLFPRINKKAIQAKNNELDNVRTKPTVEQLLQEEKSIVSNLDNYYEDLNDDGIAGKDEKIGNFKPEVKRQLDDLNLERQSLVNHIEDISHDMLRAQQELVEVSADIDSITNKVSSYQQIAADANKDGIIDIQEAAKATLKPEVQEEVQALTNQKNQLANRIEDAREMSGMSQSRILQIDTETQDILRDASSRSKVKMKAEAKIRLAQIGNQEALTLRQKSKKIVELEKEIRVLTQKGIIGAGKKIVRVFSVAGGVVLVVDMGLRSYLVVGLEKNAGWAPSVQVTHSACTAFETCEAAVQAMTGALSNSLVNIVEKANRKIYSQQKEENKN